MLCEQRGYFRRATGVTFFERGCFASRGGTFDMQRGGGGVLTCMQQVVL